MIAVAAMLAAAAPVTCGAVTRPGIAERGADGVWRGRAVDLCRKVARAGGSDAPIRFRSYDTASALRTASEDRVAFVSAEELAEAHGLRAGPVVATDRQALIVKAGSAIRAASDLAGKLVCFIVGTPAEDSLDAWATAARVPVERLAFQEPDEMDDAFDVGKCAATAIDAAIVADRPGVRVLRPWLAETPIMAATPVAPPSGWRDRVAATAASQAGDGARITGP